MRRWDYAVNNVHRTASYILEEAPWYVFFIQDLIMTICEYFPPIPIPFGKRLKYYDKDDNTYYTYKEYFGDLSHMFHNFICLNVFYWAEKRKFIEMFNTDYWKLRKQRYHENPNLFRDWEEEELNE